MLKKEKNQNIYALIERCHSNLPRTVAEKNDISIFERKKCGKINKNKFTRLELLAQLISFR